MFLHSVKMRCYVLFRPEQPAEVDASTDTAECKPAPCVGAVVVPPQDSADGPENQHDPRRGREEFTELHGLRLSVPERRFFPMSR